MNPCTPHRDAILDPALPVPPDHAAHLGSCPACRELERAHLAALTLRGELPQAPRVSAARVARRAATVASLLLLATLGAWRLSRPAPAVAPAETMEARAAAVPRLPSSAAEEAAWLVFWAQQDVQALETHRRPAIEDSSYASFGSLARWLAPPSAVGPSHAKEN